MLNDEAPYSNRSTANGSATSFAYTFTIYASTDIGVYDNTTLLTFGIHYTLTGVGVAGGGNVVFLAAPLNGHTITRARLQPAAQLSNYIPTEAFPSTRVMQDLDKLAMQIQQIKEVLRRGFFLPISSSLANQGIDAPTDGLFARGKTGGGIDWAAPTLASPASLPISIANGGTGAITAALARIALGVGVSTPWTPSLGGNATYFTQVGNSLLIGDLVWIWCDLAVNTIGTGSVNTISGLPFTVANGFEGTGAVEFFSAVVNTTSMVAITNAAATTIRIKSTPSASSNIGTSNVFGNNTGVKFSLLYVRA